jgi:hypothetical protein
MILLDLTKHTATHAKIFFGKLGSGLVVEIFLGDVVLRHFAGADFGDIGVGRVLYAGEDPGFICVALFDQFLDTLRAREGRVADLLQIAGLPS